MLFPNKLFVRTVRLISPFGLMVCQSIRSGPLAKVLLYLCWHLNLDSYSQLTWEGNERAVLNVAGEGEE